MVVVATFVKANWYIVTLFFFSFNAAGDTEHGSYPFDLILMAMKMFNSIETTFQILLSKTELDALCIVVYIMRC